MTAIDGAFPLPEAAILKVAEKHKPRVIGHFHGGDLVVAVGARSNPLTLVAFRGDGKVDARSYPERPYTDEVFADLSARNRAGEFDADQDWRSRDLAASPRQLVSIGDALVIVRLGGGHAVIDPATLAIETIARSAVEQLYRVGPQVVLVGACGTFSNLEPVQLFWTYDASRIREPLVRCRSRETGQSVMRIVDGTPFPDEDGEIPLAAGIERVRGVADTFHDRMHVAAAIPFRGKLFALTLGLLRSGSVMHSLLRIDLDSRKVDGFTLLAEEDKTLDATFATSPAGLIAFADAAVFLIEPDALAVVDRAPSPKGIRLIGSDDERLIFHHKRSNTLVVVKNTALAQPLGSSLATLEAEIAGLLQASRAARKRHGSPTS